MLCKIIPGIYTNSWKNLSSWTICVTERLKLYKNNSHTYTQTIPSNKDQKEFRFFKGCVRERDWPSCMRDSYIQTNRDRYIQKGWFGRKERERERLGGKRTGVIAFSDKITPFLSAFGSLSSWSREIIQTDADMLPSPRLAHQIGSWR